MALWILPSSRRSLSGVMKVYPEPRTSDRDYLIISKGHAGPAFMRPWHWGYFPITIKNSKSASANCRVTVIDVRHPVLKYDDTSLGGVAVGIALGNS